MSRGHGKLQRLILSAVQQRSYVTLKGATRGETSALVRAARKLEKAGLCVVVRLWNDDHTRLITSAWPPDVTSRGRPIKELSVERVPHGTGSTFTGSIRHFARQERLSPTTIWRDFREARLGRVGPKPRPDDAGG